MFTWLHISLFFKSNTVALSRAVGHITGGDKWNQTVTDSTILKSVDIESQTRPKYYNRCLLLVRWWFHPSTSNLLSGYTVRGNELGTGISLDPTNSQPMHYLALLYHHWSILPLLNPKFHLCKTFLPKCSHFANRNMEIWKMRCCNCKIDRGIDNWGARRV